MNKKYTKIFFSNPLQQVAAENFKASKSWVHKWKKRNNVVSRKVTKTLSRKQIASLPNVQEDIQQYRNQVRILSEDFQPGQIYNTDQSGFNIELLSGRTLTTKGEKMVYSSMNQSASETHSYTIQPTISMDWATFDSSPRTEGEIRSHR